MSGRLWGRLGLVLLLVTSATAQALEDPTGGKSFLPWLWEDQVVPTVETVVMPTQIAALATGVGATVVSHQFDPEIENEYGDNRHMPPSISRWGSILGSGGPEIGFAVVQFFFDEKSGLATARSIALTSASAFTTAQIAQRERPNHANKLSFPSGHTSCAFTTAASIGYEYGIWVALPAFAVGGFVAASRVADDDHWFSDTVAAAALGMFWARASHLADVAAAASSSPAAKKTTSLMQSITPEIIPGGALVSFSTSY